VKAMSLFGKLSLFDKLLEEILFLKNASSKLKYKYILLYLTSDHDEDDTTGDKTLDEFYHVLHNDAIHALYYDELGNFFTASWVINTEKNPDIPILIGNEEDDKEIIAELRALFKDYNNGDDFNVIYGKPFEFYKGFNISPAINFRELNSIEVKMLNDGNQIVFNRNDDDLLLFSEKDPISSKPGFLSDKWTISERGIVLAGNKRKTNDLKVSKYNRMEVVFNSSVKNFPQLVLSLVGKSTYAVELLKFLAEIEISTREKSLDYKYSSEDKINPFLPYIENLENKSLFPALDTEEGFSYNHLLEINGYTRDYFFKQYERIITSRKATIESDKVILYPDIAQYFTIIETDKILIENGMKDYGLFEVTRTNHPDIFQGVNFYSFDENDNLLMMSPPYQVLDYGNSNYILFDSKLYNSNHVVFIPKSEIVSYKLYGTELMQSTVSTGEVTSEIDVSEKQVANKYQRPSITGTFFSSILFGSTYTLLNGVGKALHNQTNILGNKLDRLGGKLDQVVEAINNISITTTHKIIDTS